MESKDLKGVIAAIATPFNRKEKVDVSGLKKLTKYVVEGGSMGL